MHNEGMSAAIARLAKALDESLRVRAIAALWPEPTTAIGFTFWEGIGCASSTYESLSIEDFATRIKRAEAGQKAWLPSFSGGRFGKMASAKGSLRHRANLEEVTCVIGDHDAGTMSPREAADKLNAAGVICLIHTTSSHRLDAPRWRIIVPVSLPIPWTEYHRLADRLDAILGGGILASESWKPEQFWFFGKIIGQSQPEVIIGDGTVNIDEVESAEEAGGADDDDFAELTSTSRLGLTADLHRVASAVAAIPNDGPPDWNGWTNILLPIYAATGGTEEGREIARQWSAKNLAHDDAVFDARWDHFSTSPPTRGGAGTLVYLAAKHGWQDLREAQETGWRDSFRMETMAEAASTEPPRWLVHECLAEGTVNLLLGPPASGKTLVALRLALCIALGSEFAGRDVRKGTVVYLAAEDSGSIRRRLAGLRCDHGDVDGFHLLSAVKGAPNLTSRTTGDSKALLEVCREHRPALVIVDTFAAATPGADENSGKDMGEAYALLSEVAAQGATVLVLHHPRKGGTTDARGHGSQVATVATALAVEKGLDGVLRVCSVKARDAGATSEFAFRIETRCIGVDDKGRELVAPLALPAAASEAKRMPKQTVGTMAYAAIFPLASRREGVTFNEAISVCIDGAVSAAKTPESQQRVIRREIGKLVNTGRLRRERDSIWVAPRLAETEIDESFDILEEP